MLNNVMNRYCKTDHTMKLAPLVALWLSAIVLGLTGAKLSKVFRSLGHYILVQLHLDPPQLLPYMLMSVMVRRQVGPVHPGEPRETS